MDLNRIIEIMKEPEKLIDPRVVNTMSGYLSGYITDREEALNEMNYAVSVKWAEIRKELKSNAEADRAIELEDVYRKREKLKLLIAQLRRYRSDLKDRFVVLTRYN